MSFMSIDLVPDEIWNLEELIAKEKNTMFVPEFDKYPDDDDFQWWERKSISTLNLNTNAIVEISPKIQQLIDLTNLNVRHIHTRTNLTIFNFYHF